MSAPAIESSTPTRSAGARPTVAIGVLASCGIVVSLIQTMAVPLLPRFPKILSVAPSTAAWLITATLVAGAVSAPVLGRLGDMYGKRRMLLVSLALIVVGSVLGALAPNFALLLVARMLQGVSFGVVALGMSLMRDVLPPEKVGGGVGLMSASLGIGGAIGLPLTGLVADVFDWRWLFAGVAVVGAVLIVLLRRLVPESASRPGGRFDMVGAIGVTVVLVCLLLAISKGTDWGWGSPTVLGLFAAAAVVALLWGRHQLRLRQEGRAPMVDLRLAARPPVLMTNLATVCIGFSMFATFLLSVQILQAPVESGYGSGMSLLAAGVVLLPIGAAMLVFSSASALISRVRGPRTTLVLGTLVLAGGNIGCGFAGGSVAMLVTMAAVASIGATLAYSALPLLIMRAVPETETAAANSLNTLMRQLGTSTLSAVVAAVSSALVLDLGGDRIPSAAAFTVVFVAAGIAGLVGGLIGVLTPSPEDLPELRAAAAAAA
ncbi:MFS transporter [Pseudonocardia ailaonensis]|uniref:MFS transporter n=1 Tax=Pseudonocardia ailaonensis TaxID=367279 RepID=A0ABN2N0W7_9PSEU